MPLVRFLGFQTGTTVAISASQGGASDSVSIDAWRTPTPTPTLSIVTTRGPSAIRCAPEAIWFEAAPSGFVGLTAADGGSRAPTITPPDTSGWGAPWFAGTARNLYPGIFPNVDYDAMPETATLRLSNVSVPASPFGVLVETGGAQAADFAENAAFGLWFDENGDLRARAGRNEDTSPRSDRWAKITVPGAPLRGRTVDIYAVAKPTATGRLKIYVFDHATQECLSVRSKDMPDGAFMHMGLPSSWTGTGDVGIGTRGTTLSSDIAGTDFNGTISGACEVWVGQEPVDFMTGPEDTVAPIVFEPDFHEIFYDWDFGDPGAEYTAPENTVPAFRDANRQFGKYACRVFTAPGTYTVTCRARQVTQVDPLTVVEAQASLEVTVGEFEADGVFDASNTVVVAADGDFTGAPAGTRITVPADRNYDGAGGLREALESAARSAQYGNRAVRLLLKRGDTDLGDPFAFANLDEANPWRAHHYFIGSWGDPGAGNPVAQGASVGASGSWLYQTASIVVDGVDLVGDYDPATGTGTTAVGWSLPAKQDGQYRLQHRANVSRIGRDTDGGFALDFRFHGDATWLHVVSDCAFSDLKTYTMLGGMAHRGRLAALGWRDTDRPGVRKGTSINDRNSQGPIRLKEMGDFLCDGCDFFCNYGWSPGAQWPDGTPSIAVQPIFRIFAMTDETETGGRAIITRNTAEVGMGGFVNITGIDYAARGNALVQGNLVLTTAMPGGVVGAGMGAVTTRGNLHIMPNVSGGKPLQASRSYGAPEIEALKAEPVADYSNTVVCLNAQSDPIDDVSVDPEFLSFTISNNVVYAPNVAGQPGHVDLAPFDGSVLFDPRYAGRLEPSDASLQTQYATPAATPSLYRPAEGSAVIGAATAGFVSLVDLLGDTRVDPPALGAVEPA